MPPTERRTRTSRTARPVASGSVPGSRWLPGCARPMQARSPPASSTGSWLPRSTRSRLRRSTRSSRCKTLRWSEGALRHLVRPKGTTPTDGAGSSWARGQGSLPPPWSSSPSSACATWGRDRRRRPARGRAPPPRPGCPQRTRRPPRGRGRARQAPLQASSARPSSLLRSGGQQIPGPSMPSCGRSSGAGRAQCVLRLQRAVQPRYVVERQGVVQPRCVVQRWRAGRRRGPWPGRRPARRRSGTASRLRPDGPGRLARPPFSTARSAWRGDPTRSTSTRRAGPGRYGSSLAAAQRSPNCTSDRPHPARPHRAQPGPARPHRARPDRPCSARPDPTCVRPVAHLGAGSLPG